MTDHIPLPAHQLLALLRQRINEINVCETTEQLLCCLQSAINEALGFNTVWLAVFKSGDYSRGEVISVTGKDSEIVRQNAVIVSDDPYMKALFTESKPVYIRNMMTDSRTNKDLVKQWNSRTALSCQLHFEGRRLGALCTASFGEEGIVLLNESEISFFEAITKATSIALNSITSNQRANEDQLTSLKNRRGLSFQAGKLISLAKRNKTKLGLVYIDLNNFKPINDVFGHNVGDTVLQQFSDILLRSVRESDVVARVGGDEFIVILNDMKDATVV